ncbi:UNVERIFIED_CONTAM: hypothetical protein K2H54_004409 [Gekko kuhli]
MEYLQESQAEVGTMLVLSGLAYFLLSKKHKEAAADGPLGQYSDSCRTPTAEASPEDTEQTYTFLGGSRRGQRGSLLSYARSILTGLRSQEGAVGPPGRPMARRQGRFGEKAVSIVLSVQDNAGSLAQESTSDTAPILGPTAVTSP